MRALLLIAAFGAAIAALSAASDSGAVIGNETVNYSYDPLGRLTGSTTTSGPNNTRTTGTCFDRAGNRMRYDVNTAAPAICPTPSPTPS